MFKLATFVCQIVHIALIKLHVLHVMYLILIVKLLNLVNILFYSLINFRCEEMSVWYLF